MTLTLPSHPLAADVALFILSAALLGIVVTALFVIGLLERRNWTFARMGIDSMLVIAAYFGGLLLLYRLR